jgi:hypothetical protein
MQPKPHAVYKGNAMKGMSVQGAIAPLHQKHIQDDVENLTPMELANFYGFERHQRIRACPIV